MLENRGSPLRCSPLRSTEAPRCAALHHASFAKGWPLADFERLMSTASVIADGARANDRLIGFVLSRRAADEAEILTIAIDPAFRGRGAATTLLAFHIGRLTQVGVADLFLEVDESNTPALALYKRYGFAKVGERAGYYARPDGGRAVALVLRCRL